MNISDAAYQRCISEYSTGRFKLRIGEIKVEWKFDKNAVRSSVRNKRTGMEYEIPRALIMIHRPTGIMMQTYIYGKGKTKSELSKLRQEAVERYLPYIENLVNLHLKAAMGRQFGPIPEGEYEV